ncbi:unnamed protein product [Moneuplotes crassus]|uniref:Uncharacterized protein n=1 Tax=Euplotes crassus TaxID=5936 RepID=A0AAD1U6M5_EUPCR|nr:unnamed protein product [Moneuplotes crassus]
MEITKHNLQEKFGEIKELIHKSDFIAMDTEFTGYSACLQDRGHSYDTIEDRYQKLKYVCQRFKANQVGLCMFIWSEEEQTYIAHPYTFYILNYSQMFDGVFSVRADCLYFLSKHGFDFDKLHKDGITYQKLSEKEKIRKAIIKKNQQDWTVYHKRDQTRLSKANQKKLKEILQQTKEFIDPENDTAGQNFFKIDIASQSLRQEIYNNVQAKFPGMQVEYSNSKTEVKIKKSKKFKELAKIAKINAEEQKEEPKEVEEEKKTEENEQVLEDLADKSLEIEMGFSLIVQEIIDAKKPLVGHNLIYDMGFFYDQFIAPLPNTFLEYTEKWRECFPATYDTKVIALESKLKIFRRTDLESLYKMCSKDETLQQQISYKMANSELGEKAHDAGFDAYMTGLAYMVMTKHKENVIAVKESSTGKSKKKNKSKKQSKKQNEEEVKTEASAESDPKKEPTFKLVMGVNGQEKNRVLLSIKTGRVWNFKESFTGEDNEEDFLHVIWIQWGNPCTSEVNWKEGQEQQDEDFTLTVDNINDELSYFGDLNCVKDSMVSCYVCFKDIDYDVLEGDFDGRMPFTDPTVLSQVESYLLSSYPSLDIKVTHYNDAQKFNASLEYK